jgi:tetratricopeptide (TPR) repeat protein
MRRFFMIMLLALAGCASDPVAPVSPVRQSADAAARVAVGAGARQQWDEAAEAWREALAAYQSVDDWDGQGRARLGLAAVLVRQQQMDEASALLWPMPDQPLFSASRRAQAAYQLALIKSSDEWLARARELCVERCALAVQFDNLAARFALRAGDWARAAQLANGAIRSGAQWAEEAHARRILAEVALQQGDPAIARREIDSALRLDRVLGELGRLLDDYGLLARIARAAGDGLLVKEAETRQKSLCQEAGLQSCLAADGALR